jgi:predicted flap endonuclease-1-like 5' DNA nuclease
MGLLERIKSALGFGTSGASAAGKSSSADQRPSSDSDSTGEPTPVEDEAGVDVTVEHEPDTRSEDAVKGTDTAGTGSSAAVEPADTGDAAAESAETDAEASPPGEGVDLEEVKGIGPAYADRLRDAGIEDVAALAAADAADLAERSDMGEGRLRKLIDRAKSR